MSTRLVRILAVLFVIVGPTLADETLYRYEGDILPYDASAGWEIFSPCEPPCSESLEGGHFVLFWAEADDLANYSYLIAQAPDAPPLRFGWNGDFAQITHSVGCIFHATDGLTSGTVEPVTS